MNENKKSNDNSEKQFPVEFPSRNGKVENSPIVDNVTENEIFPMEFGNRNGVRSQSGVQSPPYSNIAEVVATEINPEQSSHQSSEQP